MTNIASSDFIGLCEWVCVLTNMGIGLPDASQLMTRSSTLKTVTDSGCVEIIGGLLTARTKTRIISVTVPVKKQAGICCYTPIWFKQIETHAHTQNSAAAFTWPAFILHAAVITPAVTYTHIWPYRNTRILMAVGRLSKQHRMTRDTTHFHSLTAADKYIQSISLKKTPQRKRWNVGRGT